MATTKAKATGGPIFLAKVALKDALAACYAAGLDYKAIIGYVCTHAVEQAKHKQGMESFQQGFRTAENLQPKFCASCGLELHAVDGNGNLGCKNGHVTLSEETARALFKTREAKAGQ